jgi:hypothetical protein
MVNYLISALVFIFIVAFLVFLKRREGSGR